MHAEELRAGLVLWREPSNASCVHCSGGFVKRGTGIARPGDGGAAWEHRAGTAYNGNDKRPADAQQGGAPLSEAGRRVRAAFGLVNHNIFKDYRFPPAVS